MFPSDATSPSLRENGIEGTAMHIHMLDARPRRFFVDEAPMVAAVSDLPAQARHSDAESESTIWRVPRGPAAGDLALLADVGLTFKPNFYVGGIDFVNGISNSTQHIMCRRRWRAPGDWT